MAKKLPKKGPHRMTTACKPETNEQVARREFKAEVDAFFEEVHSVIQNARNRMTDEERDKADKEAKAILESTSASKGKRRSA